MTQQRTLDLTGILGDEDLRGLALILDYASEQARKLDLAETTDLISRACRTLDGKLSALPLKSEEAPVYRDMDLRAWQAPEFLGGPMILDDAS